MSSQSLTDLIDERIAANKIKLDDIPLAALKRALSDQLNPDGDTFLLPHSVGADTLADTTGFGAVVTALPLNPIDGQRCVYAADATNGVFWYLRFVASQPVGKQWVCIGGSPLYAAVGEGGVETTTSTAYADPTAGTVGPSITVPLAGDYDIFATQRLANSTSAGVEVLAALKFGAAAVVDPNDRVGDTNPSTATASIMAGASIRRAVSAANTVVKVQYKVASASTGDLFARRLTIKPIRVG